jgi:hypothetical protein
MQSGLISGLQSIAPALMGLMVLAALFLLFRRNRSGWLILALVAEGLGLLFRGVLFVAPELVQTTPLFFPIWTLSSLGFAAGLLGYAIETSQRR